MLKTVLLSHRIESNIEHFVGLSCGSLWPLVIINLLAAMAGGDSATEWSQRIENSCSYREFLGKFLSSVFKY